MLMPDEIDDIASAARFHHTLKKMSPGDDNVEYDA